MSSPHEQSDPQPAKEAVGTTVEVEVGDVIFEAPIQPLRHVSTSNVDFVEQESRKTAEQWQEAGDEAFMEARKVEKAHGLEAAAPLFAEASHDYLNVLWWGRGGEELSPSSLIRRGHSLAKQAEAMDAGLLPGEIDEAVILQQLAAQDSRAGIAAIHERAAKATTSKIPSVEKVDEVIAVAAVGAAQEAGTDEHVLVHDIGKVDEDTAELLEAKGEEAMLQFIGANAMEPVHGSEYIIQITDRVETGIKDIKGLALAA